MQLAWRGFDAYNAYREEKEIVVQAGDTFENPVSGQQLTFHKTAGDTGGELLEVESVYTKPSPSRPPIHYHPRQEERFEVLSGELHTLIDGEERTLTEGEDLVIPPRISHGMWSEEAGTRVNWQTRPALKTEAFFETLWGLARDGKTNDKGVPNLLQAAVIAREYEQEYRLVSPPQAVQRVLFGSLGVVGRSLGYRGRHPYAHNNLKEALAREGEHSPTTSPGRIGSILGGAILSFLVYFLLRRLRR
jgi:quercetin dioxygenase-like cupin family protein